MVGFLVTLAGICFIAASILQFEINWKLAAAYLSIGIANIFFGRL